MSEMLKEKRATRGSRMTELVGEAAEEDELFWNNEVWQEADSDDDSFGSEDEEQKPDEFDSDFNDTESEEESDNEEEAQLNKRTKV